MSAACERLAHGACGGCDCICHLDRALAPAMPGVDIIIEAL